MTDIKGAPKPENENSDYQTRIPGYTAAEVLGEELISRLDLASYLFGALAEASQTDNPYMAPKASRLQFPLLDPTTRRKVLGLRSRRNPRVTPSYRSVTFNQSVLRDVEKSSFYNFQNLVTDLQAAGRGLINYEEQQLGIAEDDNRQRDEILGEDAARRHSSSEIFDRMTTLTKAAEKLPSTMDVKVIAGVYEMLMAKVPKKFQNSRARIVAPHPDVTVFGLYTYGEVLEHCGEAEKSLEEFKETGQAYFEHEKSNARTEAVQTGLYILAELERANALLQAKYVQNPENMGELAPGETSLDLTQIEAAHGYLMGLAAQAENILACLDPTALDDANVKATLDKFHAPEPFTLEGRWRQEEVSQFSAKVKRAKEVYVGGRRLIDPKKHPRVVEQLKTLEGLEDDRTGQKLLSPVECGLAVAMLTDCFERYFACFREVQQKVRLQTYPAKEVAKMQPDAISNLMAVNLDMAIGKLWMAFTGEEFSAQLSAPVFSHEDYKKIVKRLEKHFGTRSQRGQVA